MTAIAGTTFIYPFITVKIISLSIKKQYKNRSKTQIHQHTQTVSNFHSKQLCKTAQNNYYCLKHTFIHLKQHIIYTASTIIHYINYSHRNNRIQNHKYKSIAITTKSMETNP